MIKERYYSEMLNRCFDTKEAAMEAESSKIKEILSEMRQCRRFYINARHVLRRAHSKKMDAYYAMLRKSDQWGKRSK